MEVRDLSWARERGDRRGGRRADIERLAKPLGTPSPAASARPRVAALAVAADVGRRLLEPGAAHRPPTRPARRWPLRADGALRPRRRALCRGRRAGRQCGERRAVTAASSRGPPWQREPFPNLTHVPTANRSQSCPTQMTLSPSAPRDTPANVKLAGAAPWCGCDDDELVDRGAREPRKAQSADADGAPHEWNDDVGHARVCHGPSSAELGEVAPPLLRR